MGNFDKAIEQTLALEGFGSLVDDILDPGGLTRWGISQKSYPEVDIGRLTRDQAIAMYRRDFWHPLYDQIESEELATELFDFGVNTSSRGWPKVGVRILQESVGYLAVGPIVADGAFGPQTLGAVNAAPPDLLLKEFRARQAFYYANIVIRAPDAEEWKKKRYLLGWFRRVMA